MIEKSIGLVKVSLSEVSYQCLQDHIRNAGEQRIEPEAPGTSPPFEELRKGWKCPQCAGPRRRFVKKAGDMRARKSKKRGAG